MVKLLKKRGYFFVIDAVLGLFILVIGVVIISSSHVKVQEQTQVSLISGDLLNFLSTTKIKDLNNKYAGIGGQLWNNGAITDADNTLLQQIGEFYAKSNPDTAEKFIQNVTKDVVPVQFRYEVWVDSTLLYPRNPAPAHLSSKGNSSLLLTSKKLSFSIINRTTSSIAGPYKSEVFVWEK